MLYLFDGKDALEKGGMQEALDHLIGASVEPLIAVFLISGEEDARQSQEQAEAYNKMIVTELVPKVDEHYRTIPSAVARAAAGQAGGAEAALSSAFKHPEVFARVGSQAATMMTAAEYSDMIHGADEQPRSEERRVGKECRL